MKWTPTKGDLVLNRNCRNDKHDYKKCDKTGRLKSPLRVDGDPFGYWVVLLDSGVYTTWNWKNMELLEPARNQT